MAQNSTLNGRIFESATPCSCCNICLQNLKLGEDCTIGAPGQPMPTSICGSGLACRTDPNYEHTKCWPSKLFLRFLTNLYQDIIFFCNKF